MQVLDQALVIRQEGIIGLVDSHVNEDDPLRYFRFERIFKKADSLREAANVLLPVV